MDQHIVTDPLEDILKQIENKHLWTTHTPTKNNLKALKMEVIQVTHNKNAWQQIPGDNINQTNRRLNNAQKDSVNSMPYNRNIEEPSQENDTHTGTRNGRIMWTIDRLTY